MMNLKENYLTVLQGRKPERLPIYVANMSDFLQHYYHISARQFVNDPELHAEVTIKSADEFGFACVAPVAYILFGAGPEMGVDWRFSGNNLPGNIGGIIKDQRDVARIKVPDEPSGYFKNYLEILRLLKDRAGKRIFFLGFAMGPYSTAAFLRGIQESLTDPLIDQVLFRNYMDRCVELSIFFGTQVLEVGLPGTVLLEIFLSPDLIQPDYYHKHIAGYIDRVVSHFQARGISLPNALGPFMGRPWNRESQRLGRLMYDHFYGSKESLDVVRQALQYALPGFPAIITLSGRMMVEWPIHDITDFLSQGLDIVVHENRRYPSVRLTSLQPPDRPAALIMADKIRAVVETVNSCQLS
jgi:hypothetical protein